MEQQAAALQLNGTAYEAPAVDMVMTPTDIEREIHYAAVIISCPGGDCPPNLG
jgi:hypothetical protein